MKQYITYLDTVTTITPSKNLSISRSTSAAPGIVKSIYPGGSSPYLAPYQVLTLQGVMKDGSAVFNFNGVYDGETGRYVFSAAKDGGSRSYNVFSKKDNAEGSYKERDSGSGEWTLRTGIPVTSFPGFIGEATVSAKPGLPETFWGKWASDPQAKVVKGETYYHSDGSPYTNTYEYFHNQVKDFSKSEDYPDTDDLEDMLNDDHGSDFERGKFRSTMLLSEWDMVHTGYIVDCEYSNDYNC